MASVPPLAAILGEDQCLEVKMKGSLVVVHTLLVRRRR